MRIIFSICVIILFGLNSFAQATDPTFKAPGKPYIQSDYPPLRSGGENMSSAVAIMELPYIDSGTTCGATDEYAANCGCCGGSAGAPDLVYKFTAGSNGLVTIDLTGNYDVLVHVRDANGNVIACDDDGGGITHAIINGMGVTQGNTYYIVAEGFSSFCGDYTLSVTGDINVVAEVPITNWAIGIGFLLIVSVVLIRYYKVF